MLFTWRTSKSVVSHVAHTRSPPDRWNWQRLTATKSGRFTKAGNDRPGGREEKRRECSIIDHPVRQLVVGAQGRDLADRVRFLADRVQFLADRVQMLAYRVGAGRRIDIHLSPTRPTDAE